MASKQWCMGYVLVVVVCGNVIDAAITRPVWSEIAKVSSGEGVSAFAQGAKPLHELSADRLSKIEYPRVKVSQQNIFKAAHSFMPQRSVIHSAPWYQGQHVAVPSIESTFHATDQSKMIEPSKEVAQHSLFDEPVPESSVSIPGSGLVTALKVGWNWLRGKETSPEDSYDFSTSVPGLKQESLSSSLSSQVQSTPSLLHERVSQHVAPMRKGLSLGTSDLASTLPGLRPSIVGAHRVEKIVPDVGFKDSNPSRDVVTVQSPDTLSLTARFSRARLPSDKKLSDSLRSQSMQLGFGKQAVSLLDTSMHEHVGAHILSEPVRSESTHGAKLMVSQQRESLASLPRLQPSISSEVSPVGKVVSGVTRSDVTPSRTEVGVGLSDVSGTSLRLSRARQQPEQTLSDQSVLQDAHKDLGTIVDDMAYQHTKASDLSEPLRDALAQRSSRRTLSDQQSVVSSSLPQLQQSFSPEIVHVRLPNRFKRSSLESSRDAATIALQDTSDTTQRSSRSQQQEEKRWSDSLDAYKEPADHQGFDVGIPLDEKKETVPVDIHDVSPQLVDLDKERVRKDFVRVNKRFDRLNDQLISILDQVNDQSVDDQSVEKSVDTFVDSLNSFIIKMGLYQALTALGQQEYNQKIQSKVLEEQGEMLNRIETHIEKLRGQQQGQKDLDKAQGRVKPKPSRVKNKQSYVRKDSFDIKGLFSFLEKRLNILKKLQEKIINMLVNLFFKMHFQLLRQLTQGLPGVGVISQLSLGIGSHDIHGALRESDIYQLLNFAGEKIAHQMYQSKQYEVTVQQVLQWVAKDRLYEQLHLDKALYLYYLVQVVQTVMSHLENKN